MTTPAVDRLTPVPPYAPEIHATDARWPDSDHLKARLYHAKMVYGRHSRRNTRVGRRSDPRHWGQLNDLIAHLAAERAELRRTGQPLTTRSAL